MTESNALRSAVTRREVAAQGTAMSLDPWTAEAMVRVIAANLVALILVGLGWYQSSGESSIRNQLSWLEVSIAGALLAGIVNANWLMRGRRMVGRASETALEPLRDLDLDFGAVATHIRPAGRSDNEPALWVPGTERLHRADCALVAGKNVQVLKPEQQADLRDCEVCRAR